MRLVLPKSNYFPISQVGNSNVNRRLHVQGDATRQILRLLAELVHGSVCKEESQRQAGPEIHSPLWQERILQRLNNNYVPAHFYSHLRRNRIQKKNSAKITGTTA